MLQQNQKETICQPGKFDVVVTSYEMVIKVRVGVGGGPCLTSCAEGQLSECVW